MLSDKSAVFSLNFQKVGQKQGKKRLKHTCELHLLIAFRCYLRDLDTESKHEKPRYTDLLGMVYLLFVIKIKSRLEIDSESKSLLKICFDRFFTTFSLPFEN